MKKTLISASMFLYVAMQFSTASVVGMQQQDAQNVQPNVQQNVAQFADAAKAYLRSALESTRVKDAGYSSNCKGGELTLHIKMFQKYYFEHFLYIATQKLNDRALAFYPNIINKDDQGRVNLTDALRKEILVELNDAAIDRSINQGNILQSDRDFINTMEPRQESYPGPEFSMRSDLVPYSLAIPSERSLIMNENGELSYFLDRENPAGVHAELNVYAIDVLAIGEFKDFLKWHKQMLDRIRFVSMHIALNKAKYVVNQMIAYNFDDEDDKAFALMCMESYLNSGCQWGLAQLFLFNNNGAKTTDTFGDNTNYEYLFNCDADAAPLNIFYRERVIPENGQCDWLCKYANLQYYTNAYRLDKNLQYTINFFNDVIDKNSARFFELGKSPGWCMDNLIKSLLYVDTMNSGYWMM